MTAKIIDGKQIANEIILEIKKTISKATMISLKVLKIVLTRIMYIIIR
jgi:hypothetical protein